MVASGILRLGGDHDIHCVVDTDMLLHRRATLPFHANGMRFTAYATSEPTEDEAPLRQRDPTLHVIDLVGRSPQAAREVP